MAKPEKGYYCESCEKYVEGSDLLSRRECSRDSCGTEFVAEDRHCPDCNSPFSRKIHESVCPDCEEDLELTDIYACDNDDCEHDGYHLTEEAANHCGKEEPINGQAFASA